MTAPAGPAGDAPDSLTPSHPADGPSAEASTGAVLATKPCPVCGEPIQASARKCVHCSSDLDWRRFLGLSSTSLAVLTALIAVAGAVAPIIKSALEPKDSRLHFTFMGAGSMRGVTQDGQLTHGDTVLLATNDGTKGGAIVGAELQVMWRAGGRTHDLAAALWTAGDEPVIVPPGAAIAARLFNDPHVDLGQGTSAADALALVTPGDPAAPLTAPLETATCRVALTIANASGSTEDVAIPARCATLHPFLKTAILHPGL